MKHSKFFIVSALTLLLGLGVGAGVGLNSKSSSNVIKTEADAGKATKDYPMIVNCWSDVGTGFFNNCDVGIHCWGGDLTNAVTIKVDKMTTHMGTGIIPKGTQYMKVVRAGSGLLPCDGWPSTVHNEYGQWSFDSAKNVITIKSSGGDQEYNDNKCILIKDRPVFFDTQDSGFWFGDNATAYAVTGSMSGWYDYTVSEGWNKLTRIGTSGYMYFTPSSTIIAPQVIVTRNKTNTSGWGNKWNQTTDMTANYGFNPLYTTMVETGKTGDNYNWGNKSATETASEYGFYFMDKITCSGNGSITSPSSNWTTVKNFYNNLTKNVQGEAWDAVASKTGNNIQQAMYRYDYIVFYKQYSGYDDFINRSTSEGKAFAFNNSNLVSASNNNAATIAIVLVSVGALAAVGGYFFLRKRKAD